MWKLLIRYFDLCYLSDKFIDISMSMTYLEMFSDIVSFKWRRYHVLEMRRFVSFFEMPRRGWRVRDFIYRMLPLPDSMTDAPTHA
jgi:hypothetical protein